MRWLVLQCSAPPIVEGTITLSTVGMKMNLAALCRATVPDLLPDTGPVDSFAALWDRIINEEQRERFVVFLEWLVISDAACAQRLIGLTPLVLTPAEAWRASAPVVFDEMAGDVAAPLARRWLALPLRAPDTPATSGLTQSQAKAHRRIAAMARAFFARPDFPCKIQPRLMPLCLGPTGVGKTSLLRRIAEENKAAFLRTSAGEWVPMGVRSVRPTIASILVAVAGSSSGATVVLIDEIDKVAGGTDSTWARSVLNEIYAVLDRSLPIETLLHGDERIKISISGEELRHRVETKLFLAAAGTWQSLWTGGVSMGFGGTKSQPGQVLDHIATQRIVPLELLMRFSWPPIVLQYPDQSETAELFEKMGLTEFAANVGVLLDPAQHDWTKGGMRSLESIAGDLLVRLHDVAPNR
jgi:hypothetical protein